MDSRCINALPEDVACVETQDRSLGLFQIQIKVFEIFDLPDFCSNLFI